MSTWMSWAEPSPDGRLLAVGTADGRVMIWDLPEATRLAHHDFAAHVVCLRWLSAEHVLVATKDGRVRLLGDRGAAEQAALDSEHGDLRSMAVHASGDRFATGGTDCVARVWDTDGLTMRFEVEPGKTQVNAVCFVGDVLVLGRDSGFFEAWKDGGTESVAAGTVFGHCGIASMGASPSGDAVVMGGTAGSMLAVTTGTPWRGAQTWRGTPPRSIAANSIAFAPDGKRFVVACSDGAALLFDSTDDLAGRALGKRFWLMQPKPEWSQSMIVSSAAFSPDGTTVYTAGFDGAVRAWDLSRPVPEDTTLPIEAVPGA